MTLKAEKRARRAAEAAAASRGDWLSRKEVPCYFLAPLEQPRYRSWLRIYQGVEKGASKCQGYGFHDARFLLGDFDGEPPSGRDMPEETVWPQKCDHSAAAIPEL